MKNASATFAALLLVGGCASTEPRYEVVLGNSGPQSRVEAERTHADVVAKIPPLLYNYTPVRILSSPFPDYPQQWRNANIEGTVTVQFTIEPDGSVSNPAVMGSPPAELAASTLLSIMQWKFVPATKNGSPVRTRAQQEFVFAIH